MLDADRTRSVAVAVTALAQVAVGLGSQLVVPAGRDTGAISDANPSPITPAGYAFAVWGVIYLACLVLAAAQLRQSELTREVHRRTGWWLVGAFTASTVWVPIFSTGALWSAQLVILALVGCLVAAARGFTAEGPAASADERLTLRLPVTLYLGWATLAAAAGFGTILASFGLDVDDLPAVLVGLVLLLAATAAAVVVVGRLLAVGGFVLTACWALVAVVVATPSTAVRVAAVLALLVIVAVTVQRSRVSRHPLVVLAG